MKAGISNFEMEKAIKSSENNYLKNNFVGIFPSKKIDIFINVLMYMIAKRSKYYFFDFKYRPFVTNLGRIGGVFSTFILKKDYFLIPLVFFVLETLLIKIIKKLISKFTHKLDKIDQTDNEFILVETKFFASYYKKPRMEKKCKITQDLFHIPKFR